MTDHDVTNESHRAGCAECLALWADLERISAEARKLPRLTPSRDLWAGIEARIAGAVVDIRGPAPQGGIVLPSERVRRRWISSTTLRLATAASLLVAATATVTWRLATSRSTTELPAVTAAANVPRDAADEANAANAATSALDDGAMGSAERFRQASYESDFVTMDVEIRALQTLVDRKRDQLDPSTVAVLERNLSVIDAAIAESRAAFLKDPASRFLAGRLARIYTNKLTLLRDTAMMPTGI